jgi:hypothetical protein
LVATIPSEWAEQHRSFGGPAPRREGLQGVTKHERYRFGLFGSQPDIIEDDR